MKAKLIFVAVFLSHIAFSQSTFKLSPDGINEVVVNIDSLSAQQLYAKTKLFITRTFKNPESVIKADEPGVLLRFSSFSDGGKGYGAGRVYYTCNVEFKSGRYKVSFFDVFIENPARHYPKSVFNSKGLVKNYDWYKRQLESYELVLNDIHSRLLTAISTSPDSGW